MVGRHRSERKIFRAEKEGRGGGFQPGAALPFPQPHPQNSWQCLETFLVVTTWEGVWVSATGIWWVEAGGAAKHPIMHRTDPTTENYLVQNVNNAEAEKPR